MAPMDDACCCWPASRLAFSVGKMMADKCLVSHYHLACAVLPHALHHSLSSKPIQVARARGLW